MSWCLIDKNNNDIVEIVTGNKRMASLSDKCGCVHAYISRKTKYWEHKGTILVYIYSSKQIDY